MRAKKLNQGYFEQLWAAIPEEHKRPGLEHRFAVHARFNVDGPDYRIEYRILNGTHSTLMEWDGEEWNIVLAQCVADLYNPF